MPELTFPASALAFVLSDLTFHPMEHLIIPQECHVQSCFLVTVHAASTAWKIVLFNFSANSLIFNNTSSLIFISLFLQAVCPPLLPSCLLKTKSLLQTLSMFSFHFAFLWRVLSILYFICLIWKFPRLKYLSFPIGSFPILSIESSLLTIIWHVSSKYKIWCCPQLDTNCLFKLFRAILPIISRYLDVYWPLKFNIPCLLLFFSNDDTKSTNLMGQRIEVMLTPHTRHHQILLFLDYVLN